MEEWLKISFESSPCCNGASLYFNDSLVENITIPANITSIGDYVFYGCESLTSVNIPDCVISIGDDAFGGCSDLSSITIGNSVTSIGVGAFYNCKNLSSITIPSSVTYIDRYAFKNCTNLSSVVFADTTSKWFCVNLNNFTNEIGKMTNATTNATRLKDTYKNFYLYSERYTAGE